MSVVQMAAIANSNKILPVNIISLLISLISISAKSVVLSYNPHRLTMLFNFCCIVADVFKTFAIIAFVFGDETGDYSFFLFDGESTYSLMSVLWLWKVFLLLIFGLAFIHYNGLVICVQEFYKSCNHPEGFCVLLP
eukprot:UN23872